MSRPTEPAARAAYDAEMQRLGKEAARADFEASKPKPRYVHKDNCMIELDPDYYGPCTCKDEEPPDTDL
jgi:hypothetical protein